MQSAFISVDTLASVFVPRRQRDVSGVDCDPVEGCLTEDFCIHAEKVKSSKALHGSSHSQECLACPSVGRPGKTYSFTLYPTRISKSITWSSSEAKRNGAAFSYGTAPVKARILLAPQVLHWAPCRLAMLGMPAQGCAQEALKTYCLFLSTCCRGLFPELFTNVHKPLKDTSIPQLTRQPSK